MLDRRHFLQAGSAGLLSSLLSARTAFASVPSDNRLVVVILRGALDGLHALSPYADKDYSRLRPVIANQKGGSDGLINVDGYFGLHRGLEALWPLYQANELLFLPAISTQYRERSHFDGQNLLENGSGRAYGANSGWLNRAITGMNEGDRRMGLSIGPAVPLIMHGPNGVETWADSSLPDVDEDFLARLTRSYRNDALFMDTLHDATGTLKPDMNMMGMEDTSRQARELPLAIQAVTELLSRPKGPRIAVLEVDGWDTHFDQERRLSQLFDRVADGVVDMKAGLGNVWSKTAVLLVSEFGRTAAENANRGTDHGTGGLAMLAGGAVAGGRIAGEWPGLSRNALWEERDVRAVNSYESVFKSLLSHHMGLDQAFVEDQVFPNSAAFQPMSGLFRTG